MRPDKRFLKQPKHFWANVRSVSQHVGYTERGAGRIKVPSLRGIADALKEIGLKNLHVVGESGQPTELGSNLVAYFEHRAAVLYDVARPHLMDAKKARATFKNLKKKLKPKCPVPLNKQKGNKRAEAYFTGIINMLI
jgi:hypothetical protein